ncbi:MAG TPA: 2-hydroxyhepta-2,4-diene-1,7-dioate isomerase, partial [Algoriphagus sp.]|nr:2-hydroxyhepta-2,4-diene-1,7-dioate isomerase [Algoriphagus sp.]
MKLYKLASATLLEVDQSYLLGPELDWDHLLGRENLKSLLSNESKNWESISSSKA